MNSQDPHRYEISKLWQQWLEFYEMSNQTYWLWSTMTTSYCAWLINLESKHNGENAFENVVSATCWSFCSGPNMLACNSLTHWPLGDFNLILGR